MATGEEQTVRICMAASEEQTVRICMAAGKEQTVRICIAAGEEQTVAAEMNWIERPLTGLAGGVEPTVCDHNHIHIHILLSKLRKKAST